MGRSRYTIREPSAPHFLTCTINHWIPIFTRPATVQVILDAFEYRQQHREFKLYAYVILENHIHFIAQAPNLQKELESFKSRTARQLVDTLKEQGGGKVLERLEFHKKSHKKDRTYQVWEEGSHPQQIQSDDMMKQKVDYIHYNPVKRGYIDKMEDWRYSSARNYLKQDALISVITDW